DEGDTRVGAAEKFWKKNWFKIFPESGKGKFVYQQHWRGLSEDEIGMSEKELLNTDHSIHSDLRFEGKDGQLWGFTIFTGSAAENKKNKGDSFIDLKGEEKLRGQFKLAQPGAWLKVGKPKPLVVEPGGPGAESQSYAKFFALDNGTYEMGTWRQNAVEVFLNGDRINGKIVIQFAPLDGERKWLISRPKGQTPKADETTLETEVKELKEKRQKYLVWAKPGIKPKLIDVPKFKLPEPGQAKIFKIDDEKQIVTGIVHDPYIVDAHGDWIPPNEMEEMAFDFMENSQKIKIGHKKLMEGVRPVESWVERYPTTADYRTAIAGKPHDIYRIKHGEDFVNSGSWLMSIPIKNKKIWQAIKSGEINAFSFGGEGRRMPVARREMPKVRRIIEIDGDKMEVREAK
ncbi:MAG: hypothetical protein GTN76_00390, partial [Candidatus Aenigmarchaeota archaeon]|nr:hypothetical protein [Candidatus Aenigmarchaeota archaeon]